MSLQFPGGSLVDVDWLKANINDPKLRIIEVSGMREGTLENYQQGHIPGAIFWEWQDMLWDTLKRDFPSPELLSARLSAAGVDNDSIVIFYSRDVQFGIYGWWVTRYCGFSNGYVLDGAEKFWHHQGGQLEQGDSPVYKQKEFSPIFYRRETMRARRETVLDSLGKQNTILIDARTPEEYTGAVVTPGGSGGAMRSGRIPGAVSVPYFTLLDKNKRILPQAELANKLAPLELSKYKNIYVYCRLGHRASFMYFILHEVLGYDNVRSYDGSWIEWGNIVGYPIEK